MQKYIRNMRVWETEFYAVSYLTGELTRFTGMYITGSTYQIAVRNLRDLQLDYLQLTGVTFPSLEHAIMDEKFYSRLSDPKNIVKGMDYDDFNDWLSLAVDKKDLLSARDAFVEAGGLEEYIKAIDAFIKVKYDDKEDTGEEEEEKDT